MGAIEVERLRKHFDPPKGPVAVADVSFQIEEGEIFSLLGPNGAGKTTTISILSCLLKPDSGEARVGGFSVTREPEKVKALIGVVPQDIALYDDWFPVVKLATRTNALPERVVSAYLSGRHAGNTLDLLEPNHSGVLYPYIIDNQRFPADFGKTVLRCDKRCDRCGYCAQVLERVLVNAEEYGAL